MSNFGFTPAPRENLGEVHMLPPRFEQILAVSRSIRKEHRTVGTIPSQATLVAEGDPERQPIGVAHLGMIFRQTGIPFNNPDIPAIAKLDSRVPAGFYHYLYHKPVHWLKDESFVHIPCFSRYVINKEGVIANAWSAKEVVSDSPFMIELCPDGANRVRKHPRANILALAFTKLPNDFVDYGRGFYSHDYKFSPADGGYIWLAKPAITTKNTVTGQVDSYRNLYDFIECAGLSFDERKQIVAPEAWTGVLDARVIQVGAFSVKQTVQPEEAKATPVDSTPDVPEPVPEPVNQFEKDDNDLQAIGTTAPAAPAASPAAIEW